MRQGKGNRQVPGMSLDKSDKSEPSQPKTKNKKKSREHRLSRDALIPNKPSSSSRILSFNNWASLETHLRAINETVTLSDSVRQDTNELQSIEDLRREVHGKGMKLVKCWNEKRSERGDGITEDMAEEVDVNEARQLSVLGWA
ncbi:hypothetical protein AMATHDRAFT_46114 [Amanita thiersii Skay4041]|uniref:Uncharacterized protein n=1 Tax=Amanita thiersii Skay4041 TaxID=703135 RepID=A0A2A9NPT8_9AGAR|nr:hypothetical protein AMATHDRAFT_46114 [Amanita thiersii Skay4041]